MLTAQQKRSIREWAIYLGVTVPFAFAAGGAFYLLLTWAGVQ